MEAIKWQPVILLLGIWLRHTAGVLRGECSKCLSNNVACLNEWEFTTCLNGELTNNLVRCPANSVCTAETAICQSPADGFQPVCFKDNCGNCGQPNTNFACLSKTTYGFCYDDVEIDPDSIKSCPAGSVCNVQSPKVCVVEADGGIASCAQPGEETTTEPPTTQGPPIEPDTFCANQRKTGNFKAADDPTCREYIYCYLLAGQYLGSRYVCEGYYNAERAQCQIEKPMDC